MMQVTGIRIERGQQVLVDGLDFSVPAGSALMLRGPNGSGKSTLLRALLGLTPVQAGQIQWQDDRFAPGSGRLCAHALWLGHAHGLKGELSAIDNLELLAGLDGTRPTRTQLRQVLERVALGKRPNVETRRLSQGQRQRLALARLLLSPHRPLWLLDEPSAALDTEGSTLLDTLLEEHLEGGGSALIASFFVLACLMVPFAVGPETDWLARLGPGIIWVMALLAQLTALPMLFANDHQDGSLEHMLASGRSATALVAGKLLAVWLVSALPLIVITPIMALALSVDLPRTGLLVLTLLLGTPTLLVLGAIGAALTLGVRAGAALVALLCLPLYVPVLIFGAGAVDMVTAGLSPDAHLALLAAGMVLATWGGPYLVALALRTSLE